MATNLLDKREVWFDAHLGTDGPRSDFTPRLSYIDVRDRIADGASIGWCLNSSLAITLNVGLWPKQPPSIRTSVMAGRRLPPRPIVSSPRLPTRLARQSINKTVQGHLSGPRAGGIGLLRLVSRDYAPDPKRREQGEIYFIEANGYNADHAVKVVEAVNSSLAAGIRPEEIAIFYRAIGPLVEAIKDEFTRRNAEFVWERDNKFPSSPFIIWLQRLAAWSLSPSEDREHTFSQLFHDFQLLQAAGQIDGVEHLLEFRILLWRLATKTVNENINAGEWLAEAESLIDFQSLLSASEEYSHDLECYEKLKEVLDNGGAQSEARLSEFAAIGKVRGKVILTTFHASKGRQFDVVIIPGCAEGILPAWTWNGKNRRFEPPAARPLSEARRLFYVGLSRARHVVHLIHADKWQDKFGNLKPGGCSRFIEEIRVKLDQ